MLTVLRCISSALTVLCPYIEYKLLRIGSRDPSLPPGPSALLVLGNAHLIFTTGTGLKFQEWSKKYGSIYSLEVLNSNIVVILDLQIAGQFLDKEGAVCSNRPENAVAMDITDGYRFSSEQQEPSWKLKRAIAVRYFNS
ncbi:hypothetical protein K432DRAFT_305707 [Lepidopterella palustris CBS 459.81]|uniref:Cytochrome P450 n=1 Tax=Lepidopterella palustris CBS 459.81 TaxID=1314670 RepID=A0A8E2E3L7_9PEZI|nr:hypothetical protein K432DRAFT_305707 [Lepidopterella palustris CBS 459.81]